MSHGKKPKRKKQKKHSELKHTEADEHLNKRPPQVDITGRVETNFPPDLVKRYDTAGEKEERWNRKRFVAEIIGATLLAVSIGVIGWQGSLLRESNKINRDSLQTIQRAFVFMNKLDLARIGDAKNKVSDLEFTFGYENSGTTPTKFMRAHQSWDFRPQPLPDDFNFPDKWDENKPHITSPIVIGPKGTGQATGVLVPAAIIQGVKAHQLHLYFWGWIRYHDVFDRTPEQITIYCTEITGFDGDPLSNNPNALIKVLTMNCPQPQSNCYDEECKAEK